MGIAQQRPDKFNLYDIFASLLPGAVLLVGFLFPYVGIDGLFAGFSAGGVLLTLVLSFVAGLLVQAIGGSLQSSGRDFANHIQNVDRYAKEEDEELAELDVDSDINVSTLDAYFVEAFRAELGLAPDFNDWSRLHKLILAKLEATSRTRVLRLQALFLAIRGMVVAMTLLSIWFALYMVFAIVNVAPTSVPVWSLPYLSCLWLGVAGVLYKRGGEFGRDVAKYMIIEYHLETASKRHGTVELDVSDGEFDANTADNQTEADVGYVDSPTEAQFERAGSKLVADTQERTDADEDGSRNKHDEDE